MPSNPENPYVFRDILDALSSLGAGPGGYGAVVSITRPNDTNAYAGGDVIGGAIQFSNIGTANKEVMITSLSFEIDASAIISGETSYTLHLYNVTPPSALGDNAVWDVLSGDRASYLGSIFLGNPADLGSTLYTENHGINKQVTMGNSANLFGYLITNGAYTPTASRVYVINLHAMDL